MARALGDTSAALLEAFLAAWARGDAPDPRDAVAQAPAAEREALAAAIDRALAVSPAREPSPDARAFVAALRERLAWAEPPLVAARLGRRPLTRGQVVAALMERLGLAPAAKPKVELRYHELESGLLDPERVSPRVWEVLTDLLGAAATTLARGWRPPEFHPDPQYRGLAADMPAPPAPVLESAEPDDVDRLFGVG